MNADLSGSMWSVAPESATSREVWGKRLVGETTACDGGFFNRARTVLGRYTVLTPGGSLRAGPPMTEQGEGVEDWAEEATESNSGTTLAIQQDGVEYAELALGLPPVSYMAPSALPS